MRVSVVKPFQPSFKAHFYTLNPIEQTLHVKTDNEKQLGEKPELEYMSIWKNPETESCYKKDDGLFHSSILWGKEDGPFKYKYNYKDTGKTDDKNGEYYSLDYETIFNKAEECNRETKGLNDILTRGKTTGKLVSPASIEENTKWQKEYKAEHEKFLEKNKFSFFDIVNLKGTLMLHHDEAEDNERISDILKMIEKTGIDGKYLMVRSAFNGEDLENYSAAGLYDSHKSLIEKEDIYDNIHRVAASKWNNRAAFSRELHKISHEDIQPTVIV